MFKNYLKTALRNLRKDKLYTLINIFGLSIGITCFILIALFVKDELSYDYHNENLGRIFRINAHYKIGENRFNLANSPIPLAGVLVSEYPEIEKAVRVKSAGNVYVKKETDFILEERFFYADSNLFSVFSFDFIQGNSKTALSHPNSVVITSSSAEKFFNNKNPIGERITLSDGSEYLITGTVKPVPENSHFQPDFIASFNSLPENEETNWFGAFVHTYVLTRTGVTEKELNEKIFSVAEKHLGPVVKAGFGVSYKDFLNRGNDFSFVFVSLSSIHLFSEVYNEFKETGDINTIYLFSAIAVFILIIACINFINLATAKSSKRANEVGVRKALGSSKIKLIKQFLSESILVCLAAVVLSLVFLELILPFFNGLTDKNLSLMYFDSFYIIPSILFFTFALGTAAGIYPALILASFKPVYVLKGKIQRRFSKNFLRRGLVVFQFSASIILFIGTFAIYNQMEYIKNKDLGFNKEQLIVIKNIRSLGTQQSVFADRVRNNANVISASLSHGLPTYSLDAGVFGKDEGSGPEHTIVIIQTDYDFIDTYEIELKEGRNFSKESGTDNLSVIINESAVKALNYNYPLNSFLYADIGESNLSRIKIIGVVEDFHLQTFKDKIRPAALMLMHEPSADYLSVKISTMNFQEVISYISNEWKQLGQSNPLDYAFFDENFGELYKAEIRMGEVFTIFSILAILIACLGLFGLAAFTAELRTKEIGIRKVIGATVPDIISMLSREFLILVAISNIVAWPVAYFIMNKWLENFVYKAEIKLSVFVFSAILVLIIALITVSFQAIKAATANPVESLRYE